MHVPWSPQLGTMLDLSHKSLRDFSIYDNRGRMVKEPTIPMLIEELEKVQHWIWRFSGSIFNVLSCI